MKCRVFRFVTVVAPLAAMLSSTALADSPPWAEIRSISYAGTGCPAGTVSENVAPDLKAFTLLFDSYVAEVGPGIPFRESRKNCQINIDMNFPNGWSFTIMDVDYRGFASLDRGVIGTQKSSYYFQGSRHTAELATDLYGPRDEDYHVRDSIGLDAVVWSPCGAQRSLNINSQVRVNNRGNRYANGIMTIDSIDGELKHIYGIRWRRC